MEKCEYFKKCSGCQLSNLTYDKQLQYKQVTCIKLLKSFCHVNEIIGMDSPYHYRNKSQTAFYTQRGETHKGIYQSTKNKIMPVDSCLLEANEVADITSTIAKLCKGFKIKPYNLKTKEGFLRHVLIRQSFVTNEIMVALVTTDKPFKNKNSFANELIRRHSNITSIVWNINPTDTAIFLGDKEEVLFGNGYITDILCNLEFKISARSFYQINPIQTEKLYSLAKEYADLKGDERVLDAYCGTGTIGMTFARSVKEVVGVEINSQAVADANENARLNGIDNISFVCEDAGKFMKKQANANAKFDICITDPPRSGCSKEFLNSIVKLSPQKIIYISCNPQTLSRDLSFLNKNGYKAKCIQPLDMFPHTKHIEVIALICKNSI